MDSGIRAVSMSNPYDEIDHSKYEGVEMGKMDNYAYDNASESPLPQVKQSHNNGSSQNSKHHNQSSVANDMQVLDNAYTNGDHYIHPSDVRDLKLSREPHLMPRAPLPQLPDGDVLSSEEVRLIMERRSRKSRNQSAQEVDDSNLYEELPGQAKLNYNSSDWRESSSTVDGYRPSLPTRASNLTEMSLPDSSRSAYYTQRHAFQQRNENPLYDVSGSSTVSDAYLHSDYPLQNKCNEVAQSTTKRRSKFNCCSCVTTVLITLLASAALVIGLLAMTDILDLSGKQEVESATNTSKISLPSVSPGDEANRTIELEIILNRTEGIMLQLQQQISTLQTQVSLLQDELSTQSENYSAIQNQVLLIEDRLSTQSTNYSTLLQQELFSLKAETNSSYQELSSLLNTQESTINSLSSGVSLVNSSLFEAILNVSKQTGPEGPQGPQGPAGINGTQGPPGSINLDRCTFFQQGSSNSANSVTLPAVSDTSTTKILSIWCGTKGFQSSRLSVEDLESNKKTYKCICDGNTTQDSESICYRYYWSCDRTL